MKDLAFMAVPMEDNKELEPKKVNREMKLSYLAFNATHKLIFSNKIVSLICGRGKHIVS